MSVMCCPIRYRVLVGRVRPVSWVVRTGFGGWFDYPTTRAPLPDLRQILPQPLDAGNTCRTNRAPPQGKDIVDNMDSGAVGDTIRDARKAMGLTQFEVANAVGVQPVAVSKWETGRQNPSHEHRVALSDLLNIPHAELGVFLRDPSNDTEPPAWAAEYHKQLNKRFDQLESMIANCEPETPRQLPPIRKA